MSQNAINNKIGDPTNTQPLSIEKSASGVMIDMNDQTDNFSILNHSGTPEGSVTANVGSCCIDTTNGNLYIKRSDGTNTGWDIVPKRPSLFKAHLTTTASNVTGAGAGYTLATGIGGGVLTSDYDIGSDFNTATGEFTAPIAGKYFFRSRFLLGDLGAANTNASLSINLAPGTTQQIQGDFLNAAAIRDVNNNLNLDVFGTLDMSAGNQVTARVNVAFGGANTIDVVSTGASVYGSFFEGWYLSP